MAWGQKSRKPSALAGRRDLDRDELTGLATFTTLVHECADALAGRSGAGAAAQPALLLVDLEGITESVGVEGHAVEDDLLRLTATKVAREVGSLGLLARMSDRQLGVLFPDLTSPATGLDLAYRIVAAVGSPIALVSHRRVQMSATCGLVTRDALPGRTTATDLIRGAELAVREARRAGRNHIEVCTPEMIAVADETLAIGQDLRLALQDKGLNVCYQPVVDLADGSVLGFEALVRWSHPVHGQVSPSRFVPVAEAFGLISELGRMVLSTASAQIQTWSETFGQPFAAHVNVSGLDLCLDGFVGMVQECLQESGLPAGQLVLEVTEATLEPELDVARRRFEELHGIGVRIALDDFGTGRSALSYLESLAVDILKVDRSYIDDIDRQNPDGARADDLLRGVVSLGRALGISVYGEGIEDEGQRTRLRHSGCEVGQGYLFARPLPAQEATVYLRRRTAAPARR